MSNTLNKLIAKIRPYSKAVVAVLGVVAQVLNVVAGGGSTPEIVLALLTALGVHQISNK